MPISGVVYDCVSAAEPLTAVQQLAPPPVVVAGGGSGELFQTLKGLYTTQSPLSHIIIRHAYLFLNECIKDPVTHLRLW